jgi:hypothetical protein
MNANIVDTLKISGSLDRSGEPMALPRIRVKLTSEDDNFGLFCARLASTGVADTLKGPGPFTVLHARH